MFAFSSARFVWLILILVSRSLWKCLPKTRENSLVHESKLCRMSGA